MSQRSLDPLRYGLVPKSAFPESFSSSNTRRMNWILTHKLRGWAAELRAAAPEARAAMKPKFLEEFLGALLVSLGTPPTTFDWAYSDKDGKYGEITGLTPLSFYNEHIKKAGFDFSEWISLINDPRNEYAKSYTVDRLGNVYGAPAVKYINVDIGTLKKVNTSTCI
jgi:bleomycin hydrolase